MVKRSVKSGPRRGSEQAAKKSAPAKVPAKTPAKPAGKIKAKKAVGPAVTAPKPADKKAGAKAAKKATPRKAPGSGRSGSVPAGLQDSGVAVVLEQVEGWTVVDVTDGIAVHDSKFSGVHYLNHTAAAMYLLCSEPISLPVMSTILREEFGLSRDPESEIMNTIEQMIRIGLIRKAAARK